MGPSIFFLGSALVINGLTLTTNFCFSQNTFQQRRAAKTQLCRRKTTELLCRPRPRQVSLEDFQRFFCCPALSPSVVRLQLAQYAETERLRTRAMKRSQSSTLRCPTASNFWKMSKASLYELHLARIACRRLKNQEVSRCTALSTAPGRSRAALSNFFSIFTE